MALSMSRYQARLSCETFLSLIWVSGLKCFASKVRPLRSQLAPAAASAATRASVTSPGLGESPANKCSATARLAAQTARTSGISFGEFIDWRHLFFTKECGNKDCVRHVRRVEKGKSTRGGFERAEMTGIFGLQ